jgi:hypothetical protein
MLKKHIPDGAVPLRYPRGTWALTIETISSRSQHLCLTLGGQIPCNASAIELQRTNTMLTLYLRAELCLVIHTIMISGLSVVTICMMRAAIHVAQVSPAVA